MAGVLLDLDLSGAEVRHFWQDAKNARAQRARRQDDLSESLPRFKWTASL